MCKCLKELGTCLHICLSIFFVARLILGLLITVFTEFEKEVLILSIFSLLNLITLFIAFIFFTKAMFNGDTYSYKSGGYIYTITIDITKEDSETRR